MAKFVVMTIGSAGDVYPMIALCQGLKARGHDVIFINSPYFEELFESSGISFLPIGTVEEFAESLDDPDIWHPRKGLSVIIEKAVLRGMRPIFEYLTRFNPRETVLVASGLAVSARIAQEKLGFKLATIHLQSSLFISAHDPAELGGYRLPGWLPVGFRRRWLSLVESGFIDPQMVPEISKFRAEMGLLEPMGHFFSQWMHSPDMVIGLWPDWFSAPQPDWPPKTRLTGFIRYESGNGSLAPEIIDFLDAGKPPIVFTPGSAMKFGKDFFRTAVKACESLGQRAVLLTRFKEHIPHNLPSTILHATWVPMSRLLEQGALLVHHGGIGTTAQALAAGIPQLIVPHAHDQPDNANRVKALGVGDRLDPKNFSARRLTGKLNQLLNNNEVRQNCQNIAPKVVFEQALEETCLLLEQLIPKNTAEPHRLWTHENDMITLKVDHSRGDAL